MKNINIIKKQWKEELEGAIKKYSNLPYTELRQRLQDTKKELIEIEKSIRKVNEERAIAQKQEREEIANMKEFDNLPEDKFIKLKDQIIFGGIKLYHLKLEPLETEKIKLGIRINALDHCINNQNDCKSIFTEKSELVIDKCYRACKKDLEEHPKKKSASYKLIRQILEENGNVSDKDIDKETNRIRSLVNKRLKDFLKKRNKKKQISCYSK